MKYVFISGVAGSCWGWPAYYLAAATNLVDPTGSKPWRINNAKGSLSHHTGLVFAGPYNEIGEQFDALSTYPNKEAIFGEIDQAYDDNDQHQIRFVQCHWFAYQLDWIAENLPEVDIIMSLRNVEMSFNMWHDAGGFNIEYPSYKWYGDDHKLWRQMHIEHKMMRNFAKKHKLKVIPGFDADWFDKQWPEMSPYIDKSKFVSKLGSATSQSGKPGLTIPVESLNWTVYKGRNSTDILNSSSL
jgi:hypothetical protein